VHGQLCYLQLPAVDVSTSARFYERVFGWRVDPPDSGFEAPALIGQWIDGRPASPDGGPVGWIFVHDIQATLRVAEAAGATGCEGPTQDGPRRLGTFTDPAGNLVGIAQHGGGAHVPGAPVIDNRAMPTAAISPQLVYDDVGAAIAWLCDTFGFTERWRAGDHRAQLAFGNGCVIVTDLTVDRGPRARGVGRDLRTGVSRADHEPERLTCSSRTGHQMCGRSRLWCAA
jgi:predicted enzyme related to lactoylglutathione lyase